MRRNRFAPKRRDKFFKAAKYSPNKLPKRRLPNGARYIDPAKFVNKAAAPVAEEVFVPKHTFADFGFLPSLQETLKSRKYVHPTPIQDGAIPPILEGRDVIGLADTGTGKTAAFTLPIIHHLKANPGKGPVLIIAPTRELADQIDHEFRIFARGQGLYSALCLGGLNIRVQMKALRKRPNVVIGTPGRLKDLYQQRALHLGKTSTVVLDEADRMLDMGFIKDIRFLLDKLPAERQSLCFSATLPPEISRLLDEMLTDPVTVSVRTRETSGQVEQNVIKAGGKQEKTDKLIDLLTQPEFEKVLVFGQTKWSVQRLAETLDQAGHRSQAIHGNKSQPQRRRALKAFSSGGAKVLVATDVAARGLDIPNVSHVINFDQPNTYEDYIHRIGRTGRAGKTGQALTFV